ncbi:hypothetical protein Goshw_030351, partial [Gossypium schwendimanii]|nr:hypothetical protein [Gossypium schwendimanii]
MAKQFGDFLSQFLEYDTSISTMGIQKFMRIRIHLDVTIPLKRKKDSDCKWLRKVDGSECKMVDKESGIRGRNSGEEKDTGCNRRDEVEK